jgi:redox-sensing transcriptional repressor
VDKSGITKATLGRLPHYLQFLRELSVDDVPYISATVIAKKLSLGEVQVRKDLSAVSGAGKPKVGYKTADLIKTLEAHLGQGDMTNAVLVGAGKLGRALLDFDGFAEYGVRIVAGFDCNDHVIKTGKHATEILPIKDLNTYCRAHHVTLGIITTGQGSAQDVCDALVASGIRAIWNFAPCPLKVPSGVILKQENLALSLAHLKSQIS